MEKTVCAIICLLGPAVWLLSLLIPGGIANKHPRICGWLAYAGAGLSLIGAFSILSLPVICGAVPPSNNGFATWFLFDTFSGGMALLIGFIGWVIARFSRQSLDGEPRQGDFFRWLSGTLASVFLLVVSGNLVILLLAWMGTSLCLHHLLEFYRERAAAVLAARKKWIFSRLADFCLFGAVFLLWRQFETLEISVVLQAAPQENTPYAAAWLLAAAAILKSAQFPFHTWLPDTLETPTPVSALMHAGIISAGGFLLIRFSPLLVEVPLVLTSLIVIGTITAVFGSLVMLTQTSIKKALAFSTVAQMGYMMLQCGLGAFSLAALHLIAHSLYKAHAFLASGNTIAEPPAASLSDQDTGADRPKTGFALPALVCALLLAVLTGWLFGISLDKEPGLIVLAGVLVMAVTALLRTSGKLGRGSFVSGLLVSTGICALYFLLHLLAQKWLQGVVPASLAEPTLPQIFAMNFSLFLFFLVFVLQTGLPRLQATSLGRHLYVLVFNRFYVNAFVNRILLAVWPVSKT